MRYVGQSQPFGTSLQLYFVVEADEVISMNTAEIHFTKSVVRRIRDRLLNALVNQ